MKWCWVIETENDVPIYFCMKLYEGKKVWCISVYEAKRFKTRNAAKAVVDEWCLKDVNLGKHIFGC